MTEKLFLPHGKMLYEAKDGVCSWEVSSGVGHDNVKRSSSVKEKNRMSRMLLLKSTSAHGGRGDLPFAVLSRCFLRVGFRMCQTTASCAKLLSREDATNKHPLCCRQNFSRRIRSLSEVSGFTRSSSTNVYTSSIPSQIFLTHFRNKNVKLVFLSKRLPLNPSESQFVPKNHNITNGSRAMTDPCFPRWPSETLLDFEIWRVFLDIFSTSVFYLCHFVRWIT